MAFRSNQPTQEFFQVNTGESFSRHEAYLTLLALVGSMIAQLLPSNEEVADALPNNMYGDVSLFIFATSWWLQILSILDALLTTLYAAYFRVFPDIFAPTFEFVLGVWLTYLYYFLVFAYQSYTPPSDNPLLYSGFTRASYVIYSILDILFGIIGFPLLIAVRRLQYRQKHAMQEQTRGGQFAAGASRM